MKPLLLAVDTTHEFGSLALVRGDEVIDEILLHSPTGFGHVLYEHLGRLLERNRVSIGDVACFAGASGPGSFTGVRIGLACVKGLAEAAGRPVAAVSNLEAMSQFGTASLRAVVLDARRGEIYGAVYDSSGAIVQAEAVLRFSDWLAGLPAGDIEFISTDALPFADGRVVVAPRALAGAVGRVAARRFAMGRVQDAAAIDANYVRRSDAELLWRDE